LLVAFFLSGAAGLIYEGVWSRYLALFVGHSAEAQVLVIAMFLGGMSLGAAATGARARRLSRPLLVYAAAEVLLGGFGLTFHFAFELLTQNAYASLFPSLPGATAISIYKWLVASLLIFVPSLVLGTTFPLLASGALRRFPRRPGETIATLYFANSFGGAVAILVAGFLLIGLLGLVGTLVSAAALNFAAAAGAFAVHRTTPVHAPAAQAEAQLTRAETPDDLAEAAGTAAGTAAEAAAAGAPGSGKARQRLWRWLLGVSALTAVASFIYEIGWIRMLSLVMGSATHSFELMLSAFILGLAIGALAIRRAADRSPRPLILLGRIQWLMGLFALATLPVYVASFGWLGDLVTRLSATDGGYQTFNLARYGVALAVMLPSTVLAGMTLPVITNTLLRAGAGERSIGWVYASNTAGAIAGVMLAGLILLPALGLKWMLIAGAALDMALGAFLLWPGRSAVFREATGGERDARPGPRPRVAVAALGLTAVACLLAGLGLPFDRVLLTSGAFRYGRVDPDAQSILYYADGRTATVGVHLTEPDSVIALTSNGKPDASLTARWVRAASQPLPPKPILQLDESTQMLSALVALAHAPGAASAAVIGHGSGISGHFLLADPELGSLTTIEIEPRMIEASNIYYPANRRVFDDERSEFVIADAKSYFAHEQARYDLIVSEPSNPWVSGVAGLFSQEFYGHLRRYLSDRGVFAQWIHLYEFTDELVLSILSAFHKNFPDYRGFLVGDADLLLVATVGAELREPDWSLFQSEALREELSHVVPIRPDHMEGLKVFERRELSPLLDDWPSPHSDYRPVLDVGAEKARFLDAFALGTYSLATSRFRLAAALGGWRLDPGLSGEAPIPGIAPLRGRAIAAEIARGLVDPGAALARYAEVPASDARARWARILQPPDAPDAADAWDAWLDDFLTVERGLHMATAGFADSTFFGTVRQVIDAALAPGRVHAVLAFAEGLAGWDFQMAAEGARGILERSAETGAAGAAQRGLVSELGPLDPEYLLDGAVVAFLETGDAEAAAEAYRALAPVTGRGHDDLRMRLLRAHIGSAGGTITD
jgi:predicted membrane-bound spermidine synthase